MNFLYCLAIHIPISDYFLTPGDSGRFIIIMKSLFFYSDSTTDLFGHMYMFILWIILLPVSNIVYKGFFIFYSLWIPCKLLIISGNLWVHIDFYAHVYWALNLLEVLYTGALYSEP